MKFIVSNSLKEKLQKDFSDEYFLSNFNEILNLDKFKLKSINYLLVEDIMLKDFDVLNSIHNKSPLLKIILYYDSSVLNLQKVLNLPIALPFAKTNEFNKFLEFLILLKHRASRNLVKKNFFQAGFFLDVEQRLLTKDFKQIRLSELEFKLLHSLMLRNGRVVSKETLLEEVWSYHLFSNSKTLEVHISRLRKILKNNFNISPIQTIYKTGYMFEL